MEAHFQDGSSFFFLILKSTEKYKKVRSMFSWCTHHMKNWWQGCHCIICFGSSSCICLKIDVARLSVCVSSVSPACISCIPSRNWITSSGASSLAFLRLSRTCCGTLAAGSCTTPKNCILLTKWTSTQYAINSFCLQQCPDFAKWTNQVCHSSSEAKS